MKKRFIEEFKERMAELDSIRSSEDIIIHIVGEKPQTQEDETFIRATNVKYFGVNTAESLLGNFAEIIVDTDDKTKTGFIRVDLDGMYEVYEDGGWDPVKLAVDTDIRYAGTINRSACSVLDDIHDYNLIRDKLIFRPLNYRIMKNMLDGFVYQIFGDIALVLYAIVKDDPREGALDTVKIPRSIADGWSVSVDEIYDEVMANTMKLYPARIFTNIHEAFDDVSEKRSDLMSPAFEIGHLDDYLMPLVTTSIRTNGAIALFYPGVKEKLAELFDGNFYVAFTSIHEGMIHKEGSIKTKHIKKNLEATNKAFGPAETLSAEVYYYDRETKEFDVHIIE